MYKDSEEARAAYYGRGWVEWRIEDLDPTDTVTFVPREIQGQRYQEVDGEKYSYLTVNGLTCVLHLNEINTINRFFYNTYQDNFETARRAEEYMKKGPSPAMWDSGGEGGENTWYSAPAPTAWMDQDGKPLRSDEYYSITQPGLEGMPISLGKIKDLIEAGIHPEYKRPPQIISYSIGLSVLITALEQSLKRLYQCSTDTIKRFIKQLA